MRGAKRQSQLASNAAWLTKLLLLLMVVLRLADQGVQFQPRLSSPHQQPPPYTTSSS